MNDTPLFGSDLPEQLPIRNLSAEEAVHRSVLREIRRRGAPGLVWFHPANGGWRHPRAASRFKTLGVRAGVADLIALLNGRGFALELKTVDGRLTDHQCEFLRDWERAGGTA